MLLKRIVVIVVIVLDLALLSAATAWLFRPSGAAAGGAGGPTASGGPATLPRGRAGTDGPATQAAGPAPAVPKPARQLRGGPKFVTCGTVDARGDVWLGSEGDGVWHLVGNAWQQYAAKDGLASNDVQSIACDAAGRIWVGHTASGLSVFDGVSWGRYGRLDGVGGARVSAVACDPADGSVWIGTEGGLTRFTAADGKWTTYPRGLAAPQGIVNGLAFDAAGTLFAAIDDGGVAMASAADDYQNWRSVTGPETMPITETGSGLPGRLTNAVLALPDGRVYAGSTRGLSRSDDHGRTWNYLRGKYWPLLAAGRYDGVPAGFKPTVTTTLASDWVTALSSDGGGGLWVGFRSGGYQYFPDPNGRAVVDGRGLVRAIVASPQGRCVVGTYGDGVFQHDTTPVPMPHRSVTAGLPPEPPTPTPGEIQGWTQRLAALPEAGPGVDVLPDDWETTGAWCGRYGSVTAHLRGLREILNTPGYRVDFTTGPYRRASGRYYWDKPRPTDKYIKGGLLYPDRGYRVYCENNDESYDTKMHPTSVEGPDVYLRVIVPAGTHRVSLYFQNFDGRARPGSERDFEIDVKNYDPFANQAGGEEAQGRPADGTSDAARAYALRPAMTIEPELSPTIAHTRVPHFVPGVYKPFVVRGPGVFWFKIGRNHSQAAKVQGVFIDPLDRPVAYTPEYPHPPAGPDDAAGPAAALWAAADAAVGRKDYARVGPPARLAAYRYAAANGASESLLSRWRWALCAWDAGDVKQFDAWEAALPKSWGDDQ